MKNNQKKKKNTPISNRFTANSSNSNIDQSIKHQSKPAKITKKKKVGSNNHSPRQSRQRNLADPATATCSFRKATSLRNQEQINDELLEASNSPEKATDRFRPSPTIGYRRSDGRVTVSVDTTRTFPLLTQFFLGTLPF